MYRINFIHEMLINNVKKKNNLHGTTCERKFRFEVFGCACCLSLEKIIFLEVFEIVINTKNFLMFPTARLNKENSIFFFCNSSGHFDSQNLSKQFKTSPLLTEM